MYAGNKRYSNCTGQFVNLVKGLYGNTPVEIESDFREKITGSEKKEEFDPSTYKPQDIGIIEELNVPVANGEEEILLVELFPMIAKKFLTNRKISEFEKELERQMLEEIKKSEEKFVTMIDGLSGNYMTDDLEFDGKYQQD
jgi:pyruvate/oxaloacetate carboxyltransferase